MVSYNMLQCEMIHAEKRESFFCYCKKMMLYAFIIQNKYIDTRAWNKTRKANFVSLCISKYYIST